MERPRPGARLGRTTCLGHPAAPRGSGPVDARSLRAGSDGCQTAAPGTLAAVADELGYDETLRALRRSLVVATGNAQAFGIRARGRPSLLSARGWAELAEIEAVLAQHLVQALRRELRAEPLSFWGRTAAMWRGIAGAVAPERSFVARLFRSASAHPVESWRAGAPQLEADLWPFFSARTHHLANALALALNEPAPYPPLFWHPGAREFRGGA